MRQSEREAVRALPLFADMAQDGFDRLMRGGFLQSFPAGVELVRQSETADFLHVLLEGSVELCAETAGRETTIAVLRPVITFILAAVIRDRPYLMSARTLARARVLMIPGQNVRDEFVAETAFALAVVDELARGFRFMVRELKNQKLRSGPERLANWLLASMDPQGQVHLGFEKRVLAARLGMTPENLSRALATLGPYGVGVAGREITVSRPEELRRFARPDALIDQP